MVDVADGRVDDGAVHEVSVFRYGGRPATIPPARLERFVDVAVIGMDNMGLGAAIELARSGRDVVVFDARARGDNSSANALGHLLRHPHNPKLAIERRSADIAALQSEAFDWTVDLIGRQAMDCGLTIVEGSVDEAAEVALVDPFALNQGLVWAALDAGVTLHDHHRVLRLGPRRGPGHELRTNRGRLRALDVIVTETAQLTTLIPWLGSRTAVQRRQLVAGPSDEPSNWQRLDTPPDRRRSAGSVLIRRAGEATVVSVPAHRKSFTVALAAAGADHRVSTITHQWVVDHVTVADGWPRIGRTEGVWFGIGGGHDHLATEAYLGSRLGAWVADVDGEVDVPVLADLRLERVRWGKLRP